MQSMTSTTVGSTPDTTAPSHGKGDEIKVIASTVSPSGKNGQKAESSFSKSTGFSTQPGAKENSEDVASDVQGSSIETAMTYADFAPPHKQEQALNSSFTHFGTNTNASGQGWSEAASSTAANVKLNKLTAGSLPQPSLQATSSAQVGPDTISGAALAQRLTNDLPVATAFNGKLNEMLASKSEPISISPLITSSSDVAHSAISQGHSPSQASPVRAVWANMQMDASLGKWGEQMLHVLQDRVSLQATQNLQEARIRLDPPDLGKLDLVVRIDGDRLNVQINANHGAVRDALVQVSERLRAELQQQQFVHVDVNVGSGDQGDASYSQPQEDDSYQPAVLGANESADNTTETTSEHWLSTTA